MLFTFKADARIIIVINVHYVAEVSVPLTCVIIFSLASVCFVNSLDGGFVFDDAEAVVNNEDVRTSTPFAQLFNNDFWGTNIRNNKSHKSYRPLTVLSFRYFAIFT